MPAHYVRRDLVPNAVSDDTSVLLPTLGGSADYLPGLTASLAAIQKAEMLAPRNIDEQA
jgi:hypothetical protein